jgi:hypothetical protein
MDPGHERGELPDPGQARRPQILLAPGKELHAHRRRIEPVARAAEVVQLRGRHATHVRKDRGLALSLSEVGCVAAVADPDHDVAGGA